MGGLVGCVSQSYMYTIQEKSTKFYHFTVNSKAAKLLKITKCIHCNYMYAVYMFQTTYTVQLQCTYTHLNIYCTATVYIHTPQHILYSYSVYTHTSTYTVHACTFNPWAGPQGR